MACSSELALSFPYFLYPNSQCAGYNNIERYNYELQRLQESIYNLNKIEEPFLFHITIGATIEEGMNMCPEHYSKYDYQYQQLFPSHIRHFALSGGKVISFIIAPNASFGEDFIEPQFIKKTKEFCWRKTNMIYISEKYNCEIHIFNTMMPCIDTKRNNEFFNRFAETKIDVDISVYRQTKYDVDFIQNFYNTLENTIEHINDNFGLVSCFSFAVFNKETSPHRNLNNFIMFRKMLDIMKLNKTNIVAEWVFFDGNYLMTCLNNSKTISYLVPNMTMTDGRQIEIIEYRGHISYDFSEICYSNNKIES